MKALTPRLPLILLAIAGSALCTIASADDTSTPPPPPAQHGPDMPGGIVDPEKRLEHLTKQLGLSAEQQKKIHPILVEQADAMKKLADSRKQIQSVLTPEQLAKFDEMQQGMRGHRGRRGRE